MLSKDQLSQIKYTNLVGHSHYSMPFGVGKIKDHISSAAKKGHQGFALVDNFGMNGILDAYNLGKDKDFLAKIKKEKFPVLLGTKINLTDSLDSIDSHLFNVSMYATSWTGYKNMTYLTSKSSMPGNGFMKETKSADVLVKRISLENLAERSEGIMIGSGDIDGILSQAIIKGTDQEEDLIQILKELFGEKFFIEIHFYKKTQFWSNSSNSYQVQSDDIQKLVNLRLIELAKKHDVKCCLVQDSYMPDKKYFFIQNILIANHKDYKNTGFYIDTEKYIMSVEEMYGYIQENSNYITDDQFVEFCNNTQDVMGLAKNLYLDFEPALPKIYYQEHPVNVKENEEKYNKLYNDLSSKILPVSPAMAQLFKIARVRKDEALETTLKSIIRLEKMKWDNKEYLDRLALELKVLQRNGILGLLDYFLLLEDVTNFIRDNGFLRGYGRGSGGGSLLTYVMDISDIEPIKYKLLFERFFTQDRIGAQFHDIQDYSIKEWSKKGYEEIDDIVKELEKIQSKFIKSRLSEVSSDYLEKELYYIECNDNLIDYYQNVADDVKKTGLKKENPQNSTLAYLLGITDVVPKKFINHSDPTMPDFDYDTDGRDAVKKYLTEKHGMTHVTLIGTLGSLKTKGAVKDVIRQLRTEKDIPDEIKNDPKKMEEFGSWANQANLITAKFVLKPNDEDKIREILIDAMGKGVDYEFLNNAFNSELAYFYANLEADQKLKDWFKVNKDITEAVVLLLGNAKTTGIHAGGIVVSRKEIMELCPLTWDHNEGVWVTQYEMANVEKTGLIKYDFLGLKTLEDFNRCLKLVNERYGKNYTLSNIPMDDQEVFKLFTLGKTESVFQFNTDLPISLLLQLKDVSSIGDLAIITALLRPGPMKMGMHHQFVKLKNGEVKPTYLHPALEEIWSETYSLCAFQETVIQTVKKIGLFPPDVSVAVMKALSKKQKEKVAKFEKTFVDNAMKKWQMSEAKAKEIWEYLFAFSEYGFNASHSYAYCCVSYLCMWFKHYYPAEWISAVLTGASKDDFKILYPKWKDYVKRPSINESKDTFAINSDNKAVMPFSAVNGIGVKAVSEIVKLQPYSSFKDFVNRSNKSVINKKVMLNMIFAGIFGEFKPQDMTEEKYRKTLVGEYFKYKFEEIKPTKSEREEAIEYFKKVAQMNRGEILMEEISLLNFTAFDFFDYYADKMKSVALREFGQQAVRPEKVKEYPTKGMVAVGGSIQEIKPMKTKKGDDMLIIKMSNAGEMMTITVFPDTLKQDNESSEQFLSKLKEYMPVIMSGEVNRYEGRVSVLFKKGVILL